MAIPKAGAQYALSGRQQKRNTMRQRKRINPLAWLIALLIVATLIVGAIGVVLVISQEDRLSQDAGRSAQLHICSDIYGYKTYSEQWTNCMAQAR